MENKTYTINQSRSGMGKHLLEDWQFCFFMKGLVAPEEGITLGGIKIIGHTPSHNASIFFRASAKPEKDNDSLRNDLLSGLRNIIISWMANHFSFFIGHGPLWADYIFLYTKIKKIHFPLSPCF